jgi:hypothetical protein
VLASHAFYHTHLHEPDIPGTGKQNTMHSTLSILNSFGQRAPLCTTRRADRNSCPLCPTAPQDRRILLDALVTPSLYRVFS